MKDTEAETLLWGRGGGALIEQYVPQGNFTTLERKIVGGIPANSTISHLASVGTAGEDPRKPSPPNHGVRIGQRVTVREFATINGGFENETRIGDDVFVMAHCHVGHDCVLHDGVTLATRATLGGHTIVHEGANVGLGVITHQKTTIGAYAMVGMGAVVTKDVPPFAVVYGNPARVRGANVEGMRRAGFSAEQIQAAREFNEGGGGGIGSIERYFNAFDRDAGRR